MQGFKTQMLPAAPHATAPDGSDVRVLLGLGVCLTLPLGTHFQFRSFGYEPLSAIGVTMPPWPGEGEAAPVIGKWEHTNR